MINIAELLKDAPKGMKLYSPLFGEVKLDDAGGMIYVTTKYGSSKCFTETGCYYVDSETFSTECLLFPSNEVRNWEGWEIPYKPNFKVNDWIIFDRTYTIPIQIIEVNQEDDVYVCRTIEGLCDNYDITHTDKNYHLWTINDAKDGDVLAAHECYVIFKEIDGLNIKCYCAYHYMGFNPTLYKNTLQNKTVFKPANKEQCDLLFKCIKENGYEWDTDKKELKKILKHYDISNFHEGMPVLVRWYNTGRWRYSLYSFYEEDSINPFDTVKGSFTQCIPYNNDTKHLLGTTDMCDEQYINW